MSFNSEATKWLRVYLNIALQFKEHKNLILKKARRAEDSVERLASIRGLTLELVQKIHVAAVQTVIFYSVEIWWK